MDNLRRQEILSNLSLNEEELFQQIGTEFSSSDAFPPSKQDLIKVGKRWWTHNKERLVTSLCSSEVIKTTFDSGDELALASAILDLISGLITGVSPITVAVLVMKLGLEKICKQQWD